MISMQTVSDLTTVTLTNSMWVTVCLVLGRWVTVLTVDVTVWFTV